MAFGRPRVNLSFAAGASDMRTGDEGASHEPDPAAKHRAFAATWDLPGLPGVVGVDHLADGIRVALAAEPARLARQSRQLVDAYRRGFDTILAAAH